MSLARASPACALGARLALPSPLCAARCSTRAVAPVSLRRRVVLTPTAKGKGGGGGGDNRSTQMNPNNDAYWHVRGYDSRPSDWEDAAQEHEDERVANTNTANHSNQRNPQHPAYYTSRGYSKSQANQLASQNEDDEYYEREDILPQDVGRRLKKLSCAGVRCQRSLA